METEEGKILLEYIKLLSNPLNERIRNDFQNYLLLENNDMNLISEALKLKYPNISEIAEKSMKSDLIFQKEVEKYIDKITNSSQINDDDKYMLINDMKVFLDNWKNFLKRSKVREKNLKSFINDFIMGKTFNFSFDGLSLLTVHKSKGLEFDTTFVIGLNEGTLPDYRATKDEDMVEEDNNAYVALSRAKRRCYISSTRLKMMPWGKSKIQNESRYVTVIKKAVN
jgi:DNA helicase-2/ATP-dependent DNA helicase PcrA